MISRDLDRVKCRDSYAYVFSSEKYPTVSIHIYIFCGVYLWQQRTTFEYNGKVHTREESFLWN